VPEPSALEGEVAIGKLDVNKVPAELLSAGREILRSGIHKLIKSISNKDELPHQWKESVVVPIHKKGDKTDCS
jgi:hypothetical protein